MDNGKILEKMNFAVVIEKGFRMEKKLLKLISSLSDSDLDDLIVRAEFEKSYRKKKYIKDNPDFHLFYGVLLSRFKKELKLSYPPLVTLKKRNPKLVNKLYETYQQFNSWLNGTLDESQLLHVDKSHCYNLFFDVMVSRLKDMDFDISLKSMLNVGYKFPEYFNSNFPGYSRAGLVFMVLKPKQRFPRKEGGRDDTLYLEELLRKRSIDAEMGRKILNSTSGKTFKRKRLEPKIKGD